jgi:hypothetical protein
MGIAHSRAERHGGTRASRRELLSGAIALFATLPLLLGGRGARADTVVYDEYGRPVVVTSQPTTTVVVPSTTYGATVYAPAAPVYGPAGVTGQSRRVSRRTSRRTAARWD